MRVATWNLMRPVGARLERLMEWVGSLSPDVWVFTETTPDFSPGPEYHALDSGEPDDLHRPGERWAMIWSRYPILGRVETADAARTVMSSSD